MSGITVAVITNPLDVIRARIQVKQNYLYIYTQEFSYCNSEKIDKKNFSGKFQ